MLSIFTLTSASQAETYYDKDNYYAKDSEEAANASNWYGKGAHELGLSGTVDKEQFTALLNGQLPNGEQLGRIENGNIQHRPGYDLTFSAPKSASILALVCGDKRIIEAHKKATKTALNYLEKHAAQTRIVNDGKIEAVNTNNFVIAQFHHDTSRAFDPNLHTHSIVQNMTLREDGKWRSLTSEEIYNHIMLVGMIYRSDYANRLEKIGLELDVDHQKGLFEIKGVPRELINTFSTRREQIESFLEEKGLEGAKASEQATLATRSAKSEIDRDKLKALWSEKIQEYGFTSEKLINEAKANQRDHHNNELVDVSEFLAIDAVKFALNHLSEREAVFHQRDILKEALSYRLGKVSISDVETAFMWAQTDNKAIAKGNGLWTTPRAIEIEQSIIQQMLAGKQTVTSIEAAKPNRLSQLFPLLASSDNSQSVKAFLSNKSLTRGQQAATKMILTTHDSIVGIQGYAGTGKTYMLKTVKDYAENKGFTMIGLSPKASAAKELETASGIKSMTLSQFLAETEKQQNTTKNGKSPANIVILDEASMASSIQMEKLFKTVTKMDARLVLVGDTQQLPAIEAGKPFAILQKAGMQTTIMKDIMRQEEKVLLSAVYDSIAGNVKDAIAKLENNISEIPNKEERLQAIANQYLALSTEERAKTLVLAPANQDRVTLNHLIRDGLKEEGTLKSQEYKGDILVNRGLTKSQLKQAGLYQVGDIIRSNYSYKSVGLEKGQYYTVTKIDKQSNTLELKSQDAKSFIWQPHQVAAKRQGAIEVYEKQERTVMTGDTIQWLRNDKSRNIRNSETTTVEKIKNHTAHIRLENGKPIKLDLTDNKNQHWDHAYASTAHNAQGKTCDRALVHADSTNSRLTNQKSFYVELSRARCEAALFTDNKAELAKTLEKHLGEKTSALEITKREQRHNGSSQNHPLDKTSGLEASL